MYSLVSCVGTYKFSRFLFMCMYYTYIFYWIELNGKINKDQDIPSESLMKFKKNDYTYLR